jgi:hypothetical protein
VISTSAGLFWPSALIRSISWSASASTRFTSMPVAAVNSSYIA